MFGIFHDAPLDSNTSTKRVKYLGEVFVEAKSQPKDLGGNESLKFTTVAGEIVIKMGYVEALISKSTTQSLLEEVFLGWIELRRKGRL